MMKQNTYEIVYLKDTSFTKNNVYLIIDKRTRSAAIIDPACDLRQITDAVLRLDIKLEQVFISHSHEDHIRRVYDLVNLFNCNVYMSRKEAAFYFFHCPNLKHFEDEEILTVGDTKVQCLITPGHTVGSTCFLLESSLFTGDTVFIEGCGICTGTGASVKSMYQSFQRLKTIIGDHVKVFPAHTYHALPGQTMSFVKRNNIYFCFEEEDFIAFRMRKNQKNLFLFK